MIFLKELLYSNLMIAFFMEYLLLMFPLLAFIYNANVIRTLFQDELINLALKIYLASFFGFVALIPLLSLIFHSGLQYMFLVILIVLFILIPTHLSILLISFTSLKVTQENEDRILSLGFRVLIITFAIMICIITLTPLLTLLMEYFQASIKFLNMLAFLCLLMYSLAFLSVGIGLIFLARNLSNFINTKRELLIEIRKSLPKRVTKSLAVEFGKRYNLSPLLIAILGKYEI